MVTSAVLYSIGTSFIKHGVKHTGYVTSYSPQKYTRAKFNNLLNMLNRWICLKHVNRLVCVKFFYPKVFHGTNVLFRATKRKDLREKRVIQPVTFLRYQYFRNSIRTDHLSYIMAKMSQNFLAFFPLGIKKLERALVWISITIVLIAVNIYRLFIATHFPHQVVAGSITGQSMN